MYVVFLLHQSGKQNYFLHILASHSQLHNGSSKKQAPFSVIVFVEQQGDKA